MNYLDLDWTLRALLLATPGLIWWFGMKIVERLDILIRLRGGTPPRQK